VASARLDDHNGNQPLGNQTISRDIIISNLPPPPLFFGFHGEMKSHSLSKPLSFGFHKN
jgi:hypothetical protein